MFLLARSCCCMARKKHRCSRYESLVSIRQGRAPKVPLRDDLLDPIPGENPSGSSLRYDRVCDQIKEARTEDDESIPSGDWQRQIGRSTRLNSSHLGISYAVFC